MTTKRAEPIAHCPACKKFLVDYPWDGKRHVGAELFGIGHWRSPIQCAFDAEGNFEIHNWMCASLSPFLEEAWEREASNNDQHAAVLPLGGDFLLLYYYKRRGRIEGAYFVSDEGVRPLRLADLLGSSP